MGQNSKINWTDHTFNPWVGCSKVSPGCANCYAEGWAKRSGMVKWGGPRRRTSASNWRQPLKWDKKQMELYRERIAGEPIPDRPRVFCASLADWLDDEVPVEWLADLLWLIVQTPNLDWLMLTKRPQNWRARLTRCVEQAMQGGELGPRAMTQGWLDGHAPSNVWIGTTVEDQQRADERIPLLLAIPARVRFLSCEPLLGAVELANVTHRSDAVQQLGKRALLGIDWVICGGESGPKARPMDEAWARSLCDLCNTVGVAFWMKQMGGVKDARHALDQLPTDLRVRELPAA